MIIVIATSHRIRIGRKVFVSPVPRDETPGCPGGSDSCCTWECFVPAEPLESSGFLSSSSSSSSFARPPRPQCPFGSRVRTVSLREKGDTLKQYTRGITRSECYRASEGKLNSEVRQTFAPGRPSVSRGRDVRVCLWRASSRREPRDRLERENWIVSRAARDRFPFCEKHAQRSETRATRRRLVFDQRYFLLLFFFLFLFVASREGNNVAVTKCRFEGYRVCLLRRATSVAR